METGAVEVLYRALPLSENGSIGKQDIPSVPEFFRETSFKDNRFGTIKRDSILRMFDRSLVNLRTTKHLITDPESITNVDNGFLELSTQRYKLISESYKSLNACRSILVPRHAYQSFMFDGETANYAITAGNDRKIRYWDLQAPEQQSYQLNSPLDDEV